MTFSVTLGIGTNLGDRLANLNQAKKYLSVLVGELTAESKVYKTAAWGITEQPDFYNQVVEVQTRLYPLALMSCILEIEQKMGRLRTNKWGERLIDIDILFFGQLILSTPNLIIPHPFIYQRKFVLQPLLDIKLGFVHPIFDKTVEELFLTTPDVSNIVEL